MKPTTDISLAVHRIVRGRGEKHMQEHLQKRQSHLYVCIPYKIKIRNLTHSHITAGFCPYLYGYQTLTLTSISLSFILNPFHRRILLPLPKAHSFKEHFRGRRKHSQNVPKISPLHITQALVSCEHKGQADGLILHIIVKGLVRLMYREAIYHPDLSIFKPFHISLPSPYTHTFECSPPMQVPQSSEDFFISTWLDEHSEIKMEDKRTSERIKGGTR